MNYLLVKNFSKRRPHQIVILLFWGLSVIGTKELQAQSPKPISCVLSGADTVIAGSIASYGLGSCTASAWTVSCGQIADQKPGAVTVNFAVNNCSNLVITAMSGGKAVASKNVVVVGAPALSAGSLPGTAQSVNFGRMPKLLTAPAATGGICGGAYSYQWFSSSDNNKFSPIAGATAKDYQPGSLTTTTYFKRQVTCPAATAPAMTNSMTVTVYPTLSLPKLNPVSQSLNAKGTPVTIGLVPLVGGGGNLRYQWQSSCDGSFTVPATINGAVSASYIPPALNATTFFRVAVISNADTLWSSPAVVEIYPPVNAGTVSPVSQTIEYDSVPALLTSIAVTGGDGKYTYQWYSSTDNNTWTVVQGVNASGYNPGGLHVTTWYRVAILDNGVSFNSSVAVINVNGQISTTGQ